jgi:hypothetical protein
MFRISLSCLACAVLALAFVSGCTSSDSKDKKDKSADVLVLEVDEIELVPGTDKEVKVKTGKAASAEAPSGSGLTAKVADGKVTVSAGKEAKEGSHEVKVKGGKKDATIKVKVKKADK